MLKYLKENGFPLNISIETFRHEEVMEDDEIWEGWKSIAIDDEERVVGSFTHKEYRDRLIWINGFFAAVNLKEPWLIDEWFNKDWKGPEIPLLNEDETSNLEVGDWVVTKDEKIRKIEIDEQQDLPFELMERFATPAEAKNAKEINELIQELKREKASNLASWNMYGSELCAGDMIGKEKALEDKIAELRINENL